MENRLISRKINTYFVYNISICIITLVLAILDIIFIAPVGNGNFSNYYGSIVTYVAQIGLNIDSENLYTILYLYTLINDGIVILLSIAVFILSFFVKKNDNKEPEYILSHKAIFIVTTILTVILGFEAENFAIGTLDNTNLLFIIESFVFIVAVFAIFRMTRLFKICRLFAMYKKENANGNNQYNPFFGMFTNDQNNNPKQPEDDEVIDATITPVDNENEKTNESSTYQSPIIDIDKMYEELASLEKSYKNNEISKEEYEQRKEKIYQNHNYR